MNDKLPPLPLGVWTHYKGGRYEVLGYGRDSNDYTRPIVVYRELGGDGTVCVRTAVDGDSAWFDSVCQSCGAALTREMGYDCRACEGSTLKLRFRYTPTDDHV